MEPLLANNDQYWFPVLEPIMANNDQHWFPVWSECQVHDNHAIGQTVTTDDTHECPRRSLLPRRVVNTLRKTWAWGLGILCWICLSYAWWGSQRRHIAAAIFLTRTTSFVCLIRFVACLKVSLLLGVFAVVVCGASLRQRCLWHRCGAKDPYLYLLQFVSNRRSCPVHGFLWISTWPRQRQVRPRKSWITAYAPLLSRRHQLTRPTYFVWKCSCAYGKRASSMRYSVILCGWHQRSLIQ